jgi:GMP synthase-like glutamine amidotransferase
MRLHYLQHVPFEDAAGIAVWAEARGHQVTRTRLYAGDALPRPGAFDRLVIMGGPMNIYEYDAYPWLLSEKQFINEIVHRGTPVLGVCLGAQLISDVLGGHVTRNPHKEIGWFPVTLTPEAAYSEFFHDFPREFLAFHWHGDTFSIPPNAMRIGKSEACANQGFVYGKGVVALQFHLDYSQDSIRTMIEHCGEDLTPGPFIQSPQELLADPSRPHTIHRLLTSLLDAMP